MVCDNCPEDVGNCCAVIKTQRQENLETPNHSAHKWAVHQWCIRFFPPREMAERPSDQHFATRPTLETNTTGKSTECGTL